MKFRFVLSHVLVALLSSSLTFGAMTNVGVSGVISNEEADLIALTNGTREKNGLRPLRVDAEVRDLARWRSKDMSDNDYFSHDIPKGGTVFDYFDDFGITGWEMGGENIAWNNWPVDQSAEAAHKAFMESDGHRRNILGSRWNAMGVGSYMGADGKKYFTVVFIDFASKPAATPKPTAKPTPKPTAKPTPKPTPRPTRKPTPPPGTC